MSASLCLAALCAASSCGMLVLAKDVLYTDAAAPIETRVADLMARMTMEEKAAQLGCVPPLRVWL